jgi:HK97 family phage major capsid protein
MKTLKQFLVEKGISQEDFDAKTAEEKASIFNELNEQNSTAFKTLKDDVNATKEAIEDAKSEMVRNQNEQMKALNEALKEQGLAIKKLSEKGSASNGVFNSIKKALEDGKATLQSIKEGMTSEKLTFKAAGTMTGGGNVSGGNVPVEQRIEGLNTVASRAVRLLDIVSRRGATSNIISWVYQANKDGSAGQTGEGLEKNQIDFDLVVASESIKKTTAYIKVSTEMLDDIDFIESEIRNELTRELLKAVEAGVYSGNGLTVNLNGIYTVATAFAAGTFANTVDNANEVDVLTVAINQIEIANQERPNYIMMHPSDVTKLMVTKLSSTDKRYVDRLIQVGSSLTLDGIPIVKTTLVTVGEYLVGDFNKALLYEKGGLNITIGLDADDFTKNLRTIIAEWRGAMVVKNNDRTAFVKGVFATDAAALETT